ncbi:MAG: DUF2505 domain-containing protein [Actinobacteria bacterium]|nr:DUF2505 domain-containing protein [Actinomycetota bacterium]
MKLRVETTSPATVEQNFASRTEQGVREEACRESGALSYQVSIERTADGGARVDVRRVMPAQVPDVVRRFVGETIAVEQIEQWGPAAPDGSRSATVRVSVTGQPAQMAGTMALTPTAGGCAELVTGDVTVSIPFLGKRIEPEIVKVIEAALRIEHRVGQAWIAQHR